MPPVTIQQVFDLALQHHQAGRLAEAEQLFRQILSAAPQHAEAMHRLGVIALQVGRHDVAVEMYRSAIALNSDNAIFHGNLGYALRELGRIAEAITACRRALQLQPDFADAHNNLGLALRDEGHLDEAVAAYRKALEFRSTFAEACNNLGIALGEQGRVDESVAAFRRALDLRPDYAHAHNNLGVALHQDGNLEEAISEYRRALVSAPGYAEAHSNMGTALKDHGQVDDAIASYRRALDLMPGYAEARSNLLFALHYPAHADARAIFAEHRRWDEIHARPLERFIEPHGNTPEPDRCLRIGYVSPDFREHSVAFFLESFLGRHDRAEVEVFFYASMPREDATTERLRRQAAHWRNIAGLSDEDAAALIRSDGIDILVDLAGHTGKNRLLIFARKPAPVQVSYLGYCDTTGMRAMDFRLTDAHADPPGATEHLHSEQLVRLPDCAWCFLPNAHAPLVDPLPAQRAGHVTFGCFNTLPKLTAEALALWSRILSAVPGARLLIKNLSFHERSAQMRVRGMLENAGVAAERVELLAPQPGIAEHLAAYGRVDIALDTFPYTGTTTTCEALWMGVPVITLAGRTHASRVGVSLLTNVGLPEMIASSPEDYIAIAARLAADVPRLAKLRAMLRERMAASPLMDAPRFAGNVEAAYRQMWRAWCSKHP